MTTRPAAQPAPPTATMPQESFADIRPGQFRPLGPKPKVECAQCQDWGYLFRHDTRDYAYCECAASAQARQLLMVEAFNKRRRAPGDAA